MSPLEVDSVWMQRALRLAARGQGYVEPNPMVGCIIVAVTASDSNQNYLSDIRWAGGGEALESTSLVLGEGFHTRFGHPHAEREALADSERRGNSHRLRGATAYVTLEPCCHHGKTPPCTEALIDAGIGRVVAAMSDPFPPVAGQGFALLRAAGIEVTIGVEQTAAEQLNAPYLKRLHEQMPWVIAKWAMSLDGKIATRTGDSQWISGEESRQAVHQLRGRVDAILVGIGTAIADDPQLTVRLETIPPRTPLRAIVDSKLRLPTTSRLCQTAFKIPTVVFAGPEAAQERANALRLVGCKVVVSTCLDRDQRLLEILRCLSEEFAVTNLMVEGGGELLGSLAALRQIDECDIFVSPRMIGGRSALSPIGGEGFANLSGCPELESMQIAACGRDVRICGRLRWPKREKKTT